MAWDDGDSKTVWPFSQKQTDPPVSRHKELHVLLGAVELKHLLNQVINIKWLREILKEICHIFDSSHTRSRCYLLFFFVICGSEHIFSGWWNCWLHSQVISVMFWVCFLALFHTLVSEKKTARPVKCTVAVSHVVRFTHSSWRYSQEKSTLNATCDINVYDLAITQRGVPEKSAWTDGCSTTLQLWCTLCLILTADH